MEKIRKMEEIRKMEDLTNVLNNWIGEYENFVQEKPILVLEKDLYEKILKILFECISNNYDNLDELGVLLSEKFDHKYDRLVDYIKRCKDLYGVEVKDVRMVNAFGFFKKEIGKEYERLNKEYEEVDSRVRLENEKFSNFFPDDKVKSVKNVLEFIKNGIAIFEHDIENIRDILRELEYSDTDVAMAVEFLFRHNSEILGDSNDKNEFINLLLMGYETFDYPKVRDENKLSSISDSVISMLESYSGSITSDQYAEVLSFIAVSVNSNRSNEFDFVLIKVLEKLRNKIYENVNLMKDSDFMMNKEDKKDISKECYMLFEQYNYFRECLDAKKEEDIITKSTIEENNVLDSKKISYLLNESENAYLLSDLDNIEKEYLGKIIELIENFKCGTLGKNKIARLTSNDNVRGFISLNGDQIRIVCKHVKDNNYCVLGAFILKNGRYSGKYFEKFAGRKGLISDDPWVEEEIMAYINKNGRQWSR